MLQLGSVHTFAGRQVEIGRHNSLNRLDENRALMTSAYRDLPAVETLVQLLEQGAGDGELPRALIADAAREEIAAARQAIAAGSGAPTAAELAVGVRRRALALASPSLRPVINATGVIIQTNLGRAP